jgi:hypothetical protein
MTSSILHRYLFSICKPLAINCTFVSPLKYPQPRSTSLCIPNDPDQSPSTTHNHCLFLIQPNFFCSFLLSNCLFIPSELYFCLSVSRFSEFLKLNMGCLSSTQMKPYHKIFQGWYQLPISGFDLSIILTWTVNCCGPVLTTYTTTFNIIQFYVLPTGCVIVN